MLIIDKFLRNIQSDSFSKWKVVTISEFPAGLECLIDEGAESCSDGALLIEQERGVRGEGDKEKNRERAARRAKTQVRKKCKMIQASQLLTCTYRENMQDFDRIERDHKELVRLIRKYLPDFQYVTAVEPQERGALHLHLAIRAVPFWLKDGAVKVKSANLIRRLWRQVVGRDNGNIDLTAPRRNASHRVACYISKYVSKGLEDAVFNAKSYWSSRNIPKPKVTKLRFPREMETWDIVSLLAHDFCLRGYTDIAQFADRLNEFHWFAASKPRC
jgi:hypothetical protein